MSAVHFDSTVLWKILEVSKSLSMPLSLQSALEQVVNTALDALGAERGSVFLFNEEKQELRTHVATGVGEITVALNTGLVGECAATRNTINVPDCYKDTRFNSEIDKLSGFVTQSLLAIPLIGLEDRLVGVLELMNKQGGPFNQADEELGTLLASQCALALQRAQLFEDHLIREKQDHDLAIARDIQHDLLPTQVPQLNDFEILGWSQSADQTGGDIFDSFEVAPSKGFFLLADATGHGIGPALSVTQVRAMFRIATLTGCDLPTQLDTINQQLIEDLATSRFVTGFFGILDSSKHTLQYYSAGQAPLLIFDSENQSWSARDATTLPLGIASLSSIPETETLVFKPGTLFAVFSDGFFEFANQHAELFGQQRLQTLIQRHQKLSLEQILLKIRDGIEQFAGGMPQADDMTVLLFRRNPDKGDSP